MTYHFLMPNDIHLIESIAIEVSKNSRAFVVNRVLETNEIVDSSETTHSTLLYLNSILEKGRSICKEGNFKSFRLSVKMEGGSFYIYDAPTISRQSKLHAIKLPFKIRSGYDQLTKREIQILCFVYREYDINSIAFVLGTRPTLLKRELESIMTKLGIENENKLKFWCEKNLKSAIRQYDQ